MDPAVQTFDPSGRAHSVLVTAVEDYGVGVLSNPVMLSNVCADEELEHDARREVNLIVDAARTGVATMLNQQVGAVGARQAIELTARSLAEQRSLDPDAARWVVQEFARVLGLDVQEGPSPVGPEDPPSGIDRTVPPPPADPLAGAPPPPAWAQGAQDTRGAQAAQDAHGGGTPLVQQGTGTDGEAGIGVAAAPPPDRSKTPWWRRPVVIIPIAIVIIAGAVAGVVIALHKSPSTPTYEQSLRKMIPSSIEPGCTVDRPSSYPTPKSDVGAQFDCTVPSASAVDGVRYVLFKSSAGLSDIYRTYVNAADTTLGAGNCGNFNSFVAKCETEYYVGNNKTTVGRVLERYLQGHPVLVFTNLKQHVMVIMLGEPNAVGNGLAQYFQSNGHSLLKSPG
jgi:hypothetical protein